jgi:hypothetical protein
VDALHERRIRVPVVEVDEPAARRGCIDGVDVEEGHQHVEPERPAGGAAHAIQHLGDRLRGRHRHPRHRHGPGVRHRRDELGRADRPHRRELDRHFTADELGEARVHRAHCRSTSYPSIFSG